MLGPPSLLRKSGLPPSFSHPLSLSLLSLPSEGLTQLGAGLAVTVVSWIVAETEISPPAAHPIIAHHHHGCQAAGTDGSAGRGHTDTHRHRRQAHQPGGALLVSFHPQHRPSAGHQGAQVPPHAQLPVPSHCQTEEQQGGLHQPRHQVAAAVLKERHQQGEEIPKTQQQQQEELNRVLLCVAGPVVLRSHLYTSLPLL